MNGNGILLLLLIVVSFLMFRNFSRRVFPRSPKTQVARLRRIRKASLFFQIIIAIFLAFGLRAFLAFLRGSPSSSEHSASLMVSPEHVYTSSADMPGNLLAWMLVKIGLGFAAAVVLFLLFGLYRRGILFSAQNVLYIRFEGYYLIFGFIVDCQIKGLFHDFAFDTTPLFAGFLIIFIAWIMDEGRKIREEQELTV